jgi:hypothetical protein
MSEVLTMKTPPAERCTLEFIGIAPSPEVCIDVETCPHPDVRETCYDEYGAKYRSCDACGAVWHVIDDP